MDDPIHTQLGAPKPHARFQTKFPSFAQSLSGDLLYLSTAFVLIYYPVHSIIGSFPNFLELPLTIDIPGGKFLNDQLAAS